MARTNGGGPKMPAHQGFLVTIGIPRTNKDKHCQRVLTAIKQAGYLAGPTSDDTIIGLADEIHAQNDPKEAA